MMALPSLAWIARVGATALADSVVVGTAIALLACILTLLFRHRSAATRFGVLIIALVATASLPFLRLAGGDATAVRTGASVLHFADSWAPWILGIWAVIATVALARIVVGIGSLRRLRRGCRELEPAAMDAELTDSLSRHCPSRRVQVLISDEATVPAAIGFFRPAIVLPAWVLKEMSADEVRHVVIHELSHLRRWDDWTNLLQQVVKALFFFHPAIWWMENRLSLEREMACDDAVLQRATNPRGYAECLARIAERSFLRRGLAMAQAAVSRVRQTSRRVARILQLEKTARLRNSKLSVTFASVFAIMGMGAVWHTPLLLSFDSIQTDSSATVKAPEVNVPAAQAMNVAWHEPDRKVNRTNQPIRPAVRRAIVRTRSTAPAKPRLVQTSLATDGQTITRTVLVVFVDDGNGVAVWHITTWQYSPSEQVRAARKTT